MAVSAQARTENGAMGMHEPVIALSEPSADEIKKALKLKKAFSEMLDQMQ